MLDGRDQGQAIEADSVEHFLRYCYYYCCCYCYCYFYYCHVHVCRL